MNDYKIRPKGTVSAQDIEHLCLIRENIRRFMADVAREYGQATGRLLDIAPQEHEGARPYFPQTMSIETFDIDPAAQANYTGDICRYNAGIPDGWFDFIVCTEVLEHTLQPFGAVTELRRLLTPGGHLFLSVPFNFRIHGPLPDCWRFTEHGLRSLFAEWEIKHLEPLETANRFLMPIHYTLVARKPLS